jgi:hypothetical protein
LANIFAAIADFGLALLSSVESYKFESWFATAAMSLCVVTYSLIASLVSLVTVDFLPAFTINLSEVENPHQC